ncbi:MAG: magnesium transporter, partial [Thiotrichales bacterium]
MAISDERHPDDIQQHLRDVQQLLSRQKLVENLVHRQNMPRHALVEGLLHKQHMVELQQRLARLHAADIAYILEALPYDDRLQVWNLVRSEQDGEILLEVSDAVRDTLIRTMDTAELKAAAESLDADELADLAPDLPPEIVDEVIKSLDVESRNQLRAAMSYGQDAVGALMDFDMVTVREDITLEVVLRYLRRFSELPDHTDKLFVVDRQDHLKGILTLESLLINDPEKAVGEVMHTESIVLFEPDEDASDAAQAFERYDLISAPVVDR